MDINQEYVAEVINISKIKEGLYVGDEIAATNLDVIIQFKLTHMLNAAGSEIKNKWETIGIKYLTLNWSDIPTQNLFDSRDEIANRIVSFIDDALERGEGILAHSLNGMNRVCIVIVIYLMKKYKWCLQKCIEYIQTKKTDVNIQPYFIEQLQRFQERLMRKGEQIKPASWNDDDISDEEERLLRNTYINSLESCPSKVPKELINVKKRKHIEWADANPYKKEMLVHINEAQDLFYQRDPRPVTTHKRMRPGRSCIRKRSLSVGDMVRSNSKGNMKGGVGVNNMNEGKQGNMGDMGIIPNSYNINNVRPLMQRQNSATQATVGVCIGSDIGMVNMIGNSNINIQQSQQQQQQQQISVVGVSEKGQQGINNFIPIQRSIQVNANNSGINQRFFNVNANDLINNYAKFYNNQNAGNNNNNSSSNNNNNNNINPSVNVNMNMNVNQQQQQQPNLPRTNSYTNKDPSAFLNIKNNFNIASPNSLNPDNLRNYSMYKDNNNNNNNNQNNNPNTNNKENIIFATKYEQIINNNIINISNNITQNNPNNTTDIDNALAAQKGKAYIKMPTTSSSASNINNAGIGPIPNIQFPSNTNNINYRFNNSNTNNNNNNNQLLQNKQDPSSILTNNYLNNQNQIINPNMRIINHNNNFDNNERKMKVIDYSNSTPGTVLNNYHPQPQLHKNKPQSNHPQNQFLNYSANPNIPKYNINYPSNSNNMLINSNPNINNNNNNQFSNKPLNNYNPNLAKKNTNTTYKHQHNHLNNPNNVNHSNPNLFNRKNRPNTPNGPMKGPIRIKNDNTSSIIKKPTTPDTLSRLNKNTHSMYNNPIQRPNSVKKKQGPSNHHDIPHSRPSTAPHKDKINTNPMSRSNNTMINPNMRHNNNNNGINIMPGNGKRLPSPQIHSNNTLSKTQKVNPARYRAPSPVVKSSGNNAMMLGGTMKKGSYAYGKF